MPMQRRMMLATKRTAGTPTYLVPTWRGGMTATSGAGSSAAQQCSLFTAGAQVGDVAVAWALFLGGSGTLTPVMTGSGWNAYFTVNLSTTFNARAFWKVLTTADIAADTVEISVASSQRNAMGLAVWYNTTGVANAQIASDAANDVNQPTPALTIVSAEARPFYVMAANMAASGSSFAATSAWQERLEAVTTNTTGRMAAVEACDDSFTTGNRLLGYNKAATSTTTDQPAHSACFAGELVAAVA